jgi:hypothetical protein
MKKVDARLPVEDGAKSVQGRDICAKKKTTTFHVPVLPVPEFNNVPATGNVTEIRKKPT